MDHKELFYSKDLLERAAAVRDRAMGKYCFLRGIIEFSNHCARRCRYCGINANAPVPRYRLSPDEILACAHAIREAGIGTVVLQSGEDYSYDAEQICEIVQSVKRETGLVVTLSIGERDLAEYQAFRQAGADKFLLKIETTNEKLFSAMHPDDSFANRARCTELIRQAGLLTGSGCIIGLPGQTVDDIIADVEWFCENRIHMVGIGPFIPAPGTPLSEHPVGNTELVLRAVALTRILMETVNLPATTALESALPDGQARALMAGADVIMLNFTPDGQKKKYQIYQNKKSIALDNALRSIEKAGLEVGHDE